MNTLAIIGLGGVGRALLAQAAPHFRIVLLADSSGYVLGDLDEPTWSAIAQAKAGVSQAPTIESLVDDLPPPLTALLTRMLSREPGDRPKAGAIVRQLMALEMESVRQRRSA